MDIKIETLLRVAWIIGIIPILIASLPYNHINTFHNTLLIFAGRGKIFHSSSSSLLSKLSVPQKFFSHFYVLAVVWTSLLLFTTWVYAYNIGYLVSESTSHSSVASYLTGGSHILSIHKTHATSPDHSFRVWLSVFLLILMEFQVVWRLYESLYVFNYSSTARMHIFGYFTGLYFYTAAAMSLSYNSAPEACTFVAHRVAEFIVKGKNHMPAIEFQWFEYPSPLLHLGRLQWIGAIIFFYGWLHQRRCHAILGNLREGKKQTNDYQIPRGDWFEIVSCPHYLAEIVVYGGLAVASGSLDLTVWLLFAFVVVNLVFAAAETHRWYRCKFENYPSNRYVIIPFVY